MELSELLLPEFRRAGFLAVELRANGLQARAKADGTPVTTADIEVEAALSAVLMRLWPSIPVIGEESAEKSGHAGVTDGSFFLIDPIDGTREFISGRDDFAINVALVEQGFPTLGIVFAPAADRFFVAPSPGEVYAEEGAGSRSRLRVSHERRGSRPVVLASRSCFDPDTRRLVSALWPHAVLRMGSSLKFASLAAGEADLYPQLGCTMAWDTAAGQALLEAAGGVVLDTNGSRLAYRTARLRNDGFIAASNADLAKAVLHEALRLAYMADLHCA